jgi:hypothetical protein
MVDFWSICSDSAKWSSSVDAVTRTVQRKPDRGRGERMNEYTRMV